MPDPEQRSARLTAPDPAGASTRSARTTISTRSSSATSVICSNTHDMGASCWDRVTNV